MKSVVASAVSTEGERLYPRNWNFHFVGLPVINEKKQCKPSFTATEVEQILAGAKGHYKVLFALLAGTGMRIGEALGRGSGLSKNAKMPPIRTFSGVLLSFPSCRRLADIPLMSDIENRFV